MYQHADVTGVFRLRTLFTAFTEEIGSNFFFAGERHDFWELVIVAEGEVGVTAGENAWVLSKGHAVLHPPMEFHRVWYPEKAGRIIIFSFDAEGISPENGGSFLINDIGKAETLLERMGNCFTLEGIHVVSVRGSELSTAILLKQLELFLLELIQQRRKPHGERQSRTASNYAAIVKVLQTHIHENLSVGQIAQLCSMSQISVKQTFSRYAGMGIMSYFNRLKVEEAIHMLRNGSSVQETAMALGFSNQNYFSTVFKRYMGKPPTAYK